MLALWPMFASRKQRRRSDFLVLWDMAKIMPDYNRKPWVDFSSRLGMSDFGDTDWNDFESRLHVILCQ